MMTIYLSPFIAEATILSEYSRVMRRWGADEGLLGGRVNAISQAPGGVLWIGAQQGVFRFNGRTFQRYATDSTGGIDDHRIEKLLIDRESDVWIKSKNGRIGRLSGDEFERVMIPFGEIDRIHWAKHPNGGVLAYVRGSAGRGIVHLNADGVEILSDRIPGRVLTVYAMPEGRVLIGRRRATTLEWTKDGLEELETRDIGRFLRRRDGSLVALGRSDIYQWSGTAWEQILSFPESMRLPPSYAMEDPDGKVWFGNRDPDHLVWDGDETISRFVSGRNSLPAVIQDAICDADGDLWFATFSGLYQARYSPFITWEPPSPMPTTRITGLRVRPDNTIWFYGFGGVCKLSPDAPSPGFEFPRPHTEIFSSDTSAAGDAWVLTGNQVFRRTEGAMVRVPVPGGKGLLGEGLVVDTAGVAWLALGHIYQYNPKSKPREFSLASGSNGLPRSSRSNLRLLPDKSILAVVLGQGVFRKEEGSTNWIRLTPADDELARTVWRVDFTEDLGVWGMTRGGKLCSWEGAVRSEVSLERIGLGEFLIVGLALDQIGGIWFATQNHGVLAAECDDLLRHAKGTLGRPDIQRFDRLSGLGSLGGSFTLQSIARGPDGRIWVANDGGVSAIQPRDWKRARSRALAPEVTLGEVIVDGNSLGSGNTYQVPAGTSRLEIHFAAVTFSKAGEVRYRYRLNGVDETWVPANTDGQALYRKLPPGDYRFEVMASNRFGVWDDEAVFASLTVLPNWWQRTDFRVASGAALMLLGWALYQLRIAVFRREQRAQTAFSTELINSQEEERKRIAGELHDSLGQHLLLIKNSTELARRKLEENSPVRERLAEVTGIAAEALGEVRAITSNLRPAELDRLGLRVATQSMIERVAEHAALEVEHDLVDLEREWPDDRQIAIYRLIQEGLNNALKHAAAQSIRIEALVEGSNLHIQVEDDGQGFDPAARPLSGKRAGRGLTGMRERVSLLGGRMRIESTPGAGTRLKLEVPVSNPES